MFYLISVIIFIIAVLLILVILVQNPKGGLASNFSSSNQVMGVRKTTDFLEKATWTLGIALLVFSVISSSMIGGTEVATPGTGSYSFTGGTDGSHVIAAEFLLGAPPPLMTLQVNTVTGALTLVGDASESISFGYYEIKSDGGSLTTTGWNSLADQDFDGNGPANGSGNGWEEAGGSGSDTLAEAYLLGNSTVTAGAEVDLGTGFDTGVGVQDLTFRFLTDQGKIRDGNVEYISYLLGDMNGDGSVTNGDISAFVLALTDPAGYASAYPTLDPDQLGDFTGDGSLTNGDISDFVNALTAPSITAPELSAIAAVPEPGSLALLGIGGLLLARRRHA